MVDIIGEHVSILYEGGGFGIQKEGCILDSELTGYMDFFLGLRGSMFAFMLFLVLVCWKKCNVGTVCANYFFWCKI